MTDESLLDDFERYGNHDPENMYRRIADLAKQMEDAWELAGQVELPDTFRLVRSILLVGVGDSAIGGSLLAAYGAGHIPVPFSVWRGYGLPAHADRDTLVVAVDYSGDTEETLSALVDARERGCHLLAMSAGGQVAELANTWQIPLMTFPNEGQPRAAIGYLFTPLVRIFERLGFLPPQGAAYEEALNAAGDAVQRWGGDRPTNENLAKGIALAARDRAVVVYGAEYLSAVAPRWKTQLNENSKLWAFWEELPELNHNAIAGYEHPGNFVDSVYVVVLFGSHLHERVQCRMDVTQQVLDELKVPWRRIEAQGAGKLAQMVSLIALGDYVSYYLALVSGADPTATARINFVNESLARAESAAGIAPVQEPGVHPGLTIPKAPEG